MAADVGSWVREVRSWSSERTWEGRDVEPAAVAEALRELGWRVSAVVPALDEEATVGPVVEVLDGLRAEGTVHEVLVVDGGSRDATSARAAAAGGRVIDQAAAGPEVQPASGKGDALWKGVAAATGDLIVFVDADVRDLPAWWVPALLAPLCEDQGIRLVKAAYERLGTGTTGGGRVTELTARPLLNLLWPHLAGLRQPLAGEYAARRDVLTRLPFPHGYGVEIGLVLEVAARWGADAIAQVELGQRDHVPQPLGSLGRMAAEVLHAAATQLRREGRLDGHLGEHLLVPGRDDGAVGLRWRARPPLDELGP